MFDCIKIYDGTFDQEKFDKELLASKDQDGLMSKEDKKKLDELSGGEASPDTPTTINASAVVEDGTHRFVTDEEKTTWNNQVSKDVLGVANGVATLDDAGLIPSSQLPGFVDDIIEAETKDAFPETGESGKMYVDTTTNKSYRWSGTTYVPVNDSIALGETSATAYAGDKGKALAESVNGIVNGVTVVPNAQDAVTVSGFEVKANVPANAIFTDTVYVHPETHPATMIEETEEKKFATTAQLAKVDAIPEDPKYTDTIYVHPETHDASIIVESDEKKFATKEQLDKLDEMPKFMHTPYYDPEENSLFACGIPVVITASENEGKAICTYVMNSKQTIEFPMGGNIYGGGNGKKNISFYPSACVTINGGTFNNINGGNLGSGNIGTSTIIINGGKITSIMGGGFATDKIEYDNVVGHVNMIINNVEGKVNAIFGGAQGLGIVGYIKCIINNGSIDWVTAGGSNGYTGEAEVIINNGTLTVLQGCNRGAMGNIKMTINGGTIQRVYAGGEEEDKKVTATYEKSEVIANGGTIGAITAGTNGGVVSAVNVSGVYMEGVITPEAAAAMNLTKAPLKFTDVVIEDSKLVFKNGDTVVKSLELK